MRKHLFEITYEYESANGTPVLKKIGNLTREKAEAICEKIEKLDGYKLIDLSVQC